MSPQYGEPQQVTVSARTAFKIGFYGALGAAVLPVVLAVVSAIIIGILLLAGVSLGSVMRP